MIVPAPSNLDRYSSSSARSHTADLDDRLDTIARIDDQLSRRDAIDTAALHTSPPRSLLHRRLGSATFNVKRYGITRIAATLKNEIERDVQVQIVGSPDAIGTFAPLTDHHRHSFSECFLALSQPIIEETETDDDSSQDSDMATDSTDSVAIETAPNSPPELSFSKSSKSSSSSLRSSSIDDVDTDSLTGSPHFEELSLDEPTQQSIEHVIEDNNLKPESRPTLRRPQPRSLHSLDTYRGAMHAGAAHFAPHGYREHMNRRVSDGALQDQPPPPAPRMMRRAFANHSSPNVNQYNQRRLSYGPQQMDGAVPPSPQSVGSTTPRASQDYPAQLTRQSSRQSIRKTVAQLEAEFNDDDEDVPEEAILENVPISPLPGHQHQFRPDHRAPSPRRLLPPSPHSPSYTNLHSANVPKNARRPSAPMMRPPRSPYTPRRPPMMQHSNTIGSYPPEGPNWTKKQRTKSWNDDLNEEARQLSAALDEYAERVSMDKRSSLPNSASTSPARRHSESEKKQSKTTVVELPPVQKGNIMIDPLPISKEKEAVLTRTRPSWLPPKSQKEEKKHLKEWQQMMARAAQAEKKRVNKEKEVADKREDIQGSMESVWELDILRNWGSTKTDQKVKELCWRGIAPMSRGAIWQRAIGNELGLSPNSFQAALNRARRLEDSLDALPMEELSKSKEAAWLSAIERDAPSVFPELNRFAPGTAANRALSDVLKAYAMYRSDVGYVYGTHLVAGLLCLNMAPDEAFVALANLLNRPTPLGFLIHDQTSMHQTYDAVLQTLKHKHSKLHAHLTSKALDLSPSEYLDPLFRCLFAYNLSATAVSRVWDAYVVEGDEVLVNAAAAIIGLMESKLYGEKASILETVGWRNQQCFDIASVETLMEAVRQVRA